MTYHAFSLGATTGSHVECHRWTYCSPWNKDKNSNRRQTDKWASWRWLMWMLSSRRIPVPDVWMMMPTASLIYVSHAGDEPVHVEWHLLAKTSHKYVLKTIMNDLSSGQVLQSAAYRTSDGRNVIFQRNLFRTVSLITISGLWLYQEFIFPIWNDRWRMLVYRQSLKWDIRIFWLQPYCFNIVRRDNTMIKEFTANGCLNWLDKVRSKLRLLAPSEVLRPDEFKLLQACSSQFEN